MVGHLADFQRLNVHPYPYLDFFSKIIWKSQGYRVVETACPIHFGKYIGGIL